MLFTIQDYKDTLLFEDSFKTLPLVPCRDENDEFIFSSGRTAVVFILESKRFYRTN
ncbi:MAG: hypothetical protein RMJ97_05280 [Raineya sp.]|nr:hypothetical protein [Raineya sp.]MDW8296281.1 hypothetical protein [Raineya sp.]